MQLQPHQDRVVQERIQLQERFDKLTMFVDSTLYTKLSMEERDRLYRQRELMKQYLAVLDERIRAWSLPPPEDRGGVSEELAKKLFQ